VNGNGTHNQLDLLRRTAGLTPNQRLVIWLYSVHPQERSGTIEEMGQDLAEVVGLGPTVFSRTRRQLLDAGWLEQSERLGHIRYYRLSPKATGHEVVVPLRALEA
jgi:DNA-binding MarR family transcriptional regulator